MRIRRFSNPRNQVRPKPKSSLPSGCFRAEFYCQSEEGFPIGQWFVALLYSDKVEYYKLPLTGYQTVSRLVNAFSKAEPVEGKIVLELVTNYDTKIMSLTPTNSQD